MTYREWEESRQENRRQHCLKAIEFNYRRFSVHTPHLSSISARTSSVHTYSLVLREGRRTLWVSINNPPFTVSVSLNNDLQYQYQRSTSIPGPRCMIMSGLHSRPPSPIPPPPPPLAAPAVSRINSSRSEPPRTPVDACSVRSVPLHCRRLCF